MKASKTITPQLPDPPVEKIDFPEVLPAVTQTELTAVASAHNRFELAKADFEAKRANLKLKLVMLCKLEPGDLDARLCKDGSILMIDSCSTGTPEETLL
jgi:hypothetical protein